LHWWLDVRAESGASQKKIVRPVDFVEPRSTRKWSEIQRVQTLRKLSSLLISIERHREEKFMQSATQTASVSKKRLWAGRIMSALAVLFLTFDGVTKVVKEVHVLAATAQLGFPESTIVGIGILLLGCTALYVIPRTSTIGAILLTGYLGGATASQVRVGKPLFDTLFPVIFGVLIWGGLFLRDERLRALVPLQDSSAGAVTE
jgi:DoxX-like family